jgi:UDP-N-acetylglucosamine:LPS N-acetylglucosamine transferase
MKPQLHVLVVLGEGGHTKECLRLVELLGTMRYRYSYILVHGDTLSGPQIRVAGPTYRVTRPGNIKSHRLARFLKFPVCMLQATLALVQSRPDAVLTSGPGVAVPVCVVAKLIGSRVIYVECCARVRSLSITGTWMRRIADLFFVQWEDLLPVVPGAIFAGRVV